MARRTLLRPVSQQGGARVSASKLRSSPVGGWNASDPVTSMRADDAVELVNFFPRQRDVITRGGRVLTCDTGSDAHVRVITEYSHGTVNKLLAASGNAIYDVTTSTPSSIGTGFASAEWVTAKLSNRMFFANGVDDMKVYDGTTLADAGFTGLSLASISFVLAHQSRIYVVESGSQSFWYGGPNAISGALSEFDLSLVGSFGGSLHSLITMSRDGGSGPDDYLVALFDSGDAAVYSGTNPSDSTNFAKVGFFKIGRPLSRSGMIDYGDDVVVLTDRGYESLRAALPYGDKPQNSKLISRKIQSAVDVAIAAFLASESAVRDVWRMAFFPQEQMLVVNAPQGPGTAQHVMNINTGAWCKFEGFKAYAWGRLGADLYMGDNRGKIYRYTTDEASDDGVPISCRAQTAWDYMDTPGRIKHHKMQWVTIESSVVPRGFYAAKLGMASNFYTATNGGPVEFQRSSNTSEWDIAEWGADEWSGDSLVNLGWVKNGAIGYSSSVTFSIRTLDDRVAWSAVNYIYEVGGLV